MTPKERAAMQQALEALETDEQWGFVNKKVLERRLPAITTLREALEQPTIRENLTVQEPVAVVVGQNGGRFVVQPINPAMVLPTDMALYAATQPVKEVELTDDEIMKINVDTASIVPTCDRQFHFARAVIAKFKEKNK